MCTVHAATSQTLKTKPLSRHVFQNLVLVRRMSTLSQVKYVFKNLMRDWSEEGAAERAQTYGRLLTELRARLPPPSPDAGDSHPPPRVLLPGAGQGRLCLEAAIQVPIECVLPTAAREQRCT